MKNYILVFLISVLTIIAVFYFSMLYKKSSTIIGDDNFKQIQINNGTSYDNLHSNISNFAIENDKFILYLTCSDNNFLSFERELKNFIVENNLSSNFVYLDTNGIDIKRLVSDFGVYDVDVIKLPMFLYFENGTIKNVISSYDLNIEELKEKLSELGVI